MKKKSLSQFQYFPIIAIAASMLVGVHFYNKTLDDWLTHIVSDYMYGLVDDVAKQIQTDKIDLYEMNPTEINNYLQTLSQTKFGRRFTIIHSTGKVLADTTLNAREIAKMDDHRTRVEVAAAFDGKNGINQYFSPDLHQELLYVAKPLTLSQDLIHTFESDHGHDSKYVLRLAMPMTTLYAMASQLEVIVYALLGGSLLVLIVSSWISNRRIMSLINQERDKQESRIQRSTEEIELLQRLAHMLAACNSITEAQTVVADIIPRILGDINGCVSIMRDSRNQLEIKLDWGGEWPANKVYAPNDCWALRKGKHHLSADQHHHLPCTHMNSCEDDGLTLCIPLTAHGNTVGMYHLHFGEQQTIDEETKQLAFTISEHLGLALANLSLQEKLRSQALSDPLTGLFNRRYFEDVFDNEWSKSNSSQEPLSLLMLDLDHFKRFNDNFGHDAGDHVLKEVSNLLKRVIDEEHVACRLGGEELAVISPNCSIQESTALAELIVKEIRELHLEMKGLSLGQLGVSIGVTTYPHLNASTVDLIKAADTALYKAKNNGRSQAIHTHQDADILVDITKIDPIKNTAPVDSKEESQDLDAVENI